MNLTEEVRAGSGNSLEYRCYSEPVGWGDDDKRDPWNTQHLETRKRKCVEKDEVKVHGEKFFSLINSWEFFKYFE